jgi:hypothetical protein
VGCSGICKTGVGEHLARNIGDLVAQQRLDLHAQITRRR